MLTTSEIAVTAAIWVLTAAGAFFGGRAVLRRKKVTRERPVGSSCRPDKLS